MKRLQREGFRAENANKTVLSGIEEVAKLFKQDKLFINENVKRFKEEIFMYVWNDSTGEPVKKFDDVLDALRYGVYSEMSKMPAYISSVNAW